LRVLTAAEVEEWFQPWPREKSEYAHYDGSDLFYSDPEANCIDLEYPNKVERMAYFARLLATIGYQDVDFRGALLWFTQWDVWNPQDEGIGYRIVEAMHRAAGQPISFEAGPGHLFRADELHDATAMLLQPMIIGWDAFYLPNWSYGTGQFFLHISHDSFVSIVTRTRKFYDRAFGVLENVELNPKPGHDNQVRRFCHQ
jgi:hypothetical protein